MNFHRARLTLLLILIHFCLSPSCSTAEKNEVPSRYSVTQIPGVTLGNQPVLSLKQDLDSTHPHAQILDAEVLLGRGMNLYQIRAYIPKVGVIPLLESPPLEQSQKKMNGGLDDFNGNQSFFVGGAILAPYANRIRGHLISDSSTANSKWIETNILGKNLRLPSNWKGKEKNAEPHAMHGLILNTSMDEWKSSLTREHAQIQSTLHAGNFRGHWISEADLHFEVTLQDHELLLKITAQNTGHEPLPIGIGWHPFFRIASGKREQAQLVVPARSRTEMNNYDDVFPTGKLLPIQNTKYDVLLSRSQSKAKSLGLLYLDDCFVDLERKGNAAVVSLTDPSAHYGVRVKALSPQIQAIQVYAPLDKPFVAIEPQFNWGDPFGKQWKHSENTGMAVLKPGESVTYFVAVEVFEI